MKCLKFLCIIVLIFYFTSVNSQVGVGTTVPDPSSVFDVTSIDKGVLIPRVSLPNVTITMLDGANTAATGLLIYNSNSSVIGGDGIGFYYFNGTNWEQIKTTSSISDHDFYEVGSTNASDNINDNIYTHGNLAVGKMTADYAIDIEENSESRALNVNMTNNSNVDNYSAYFENLSTGSGEHFGIRTHVSGSDKIYGSYNDLTSNGQGYEMYGTYNNLSGTFTTSGPKFGLYNNFENFPAISTVGVQNEMTNRESTNKKGIVNNVTSNGSAIGVQNTISSDASIAIGTNNVITGGLSSNLIGTKNLIGPSSSISTSYASHNSIDPTYLGPQIGVYSEVTRTTGTSYAGYFRGKLAVGTTVFNSGSADFYVFPSSRGTANQIMQTDGSGNVSWVDQTPVQNASNGLSISTNDIVLGGTLTQATTITQGTNNLTFNLNSTGDFTIQHNADNVFEVRDNKIIYFGSDTFWKDNDTAGTNIGALIDDGDDGRFLIYENGILSVDLDANTGFVFNEQGLDRDFRIESDDETNMFRVDANNNGIGIMNATPNFDIHLKQSSNIEGGSGGMGFESGVSANNWKIYHSGLHFSFAENGVRRAYVMSGTGAYMSTSDRRFKKNITEIESIIDKVNRLKVYSYLYKSQEENGAKTIGFMAQDVLPLFPELVGQAEDGYYTLNYAGFGVLAVKALQEQQELINTQQQEIKVLKKSQDDTKALIERLLKRVEKLENTD